MQKNREINIFSKVSFPDCTLGSKHEFLSNLNARIKSEYMNPASVAFFCLKIIKYAQYINFIIKNILNGCQKPKIKSWIKVMIFLGMYIV